MSKVNIAKFRKFIKDNYRTIIFVITVVFALEWWQSRNMAKGFLPASLKNAELQLLDGGKAQLWSEGETTVLYVFAPWCGICRISASNMNRIRSDRFYTVSLALSWSDQNSVEKFVYDTGLQSAVMLGNIDIAEILQISAFPSYFIINGEGQIVKSWSGYTTTFGLWIRASLGRWT